MPSVVLKPRTIIRSVARISNSPFAAIYFGELLHSNGALDAREVALPIADGDHEDAPFEALDRRGELQFVNAVRFRLEPGREIVAGLHAIDRKVSRDRETLDVE